MRGSGTRATGISAQNATNEAMKMARAHRFALRDAGAVARNVSVPLNARRSFTLPLRWSPKLAGTSPKAHSDAAVLPYSRWPGPLLIKSGHDAWRGSLAGWERKANPSNLTQFESSEGLRTVARSLCYSAGWFTTVTLWLDLPMRWG